MNDLNLYEKVAPLEKNFPIKFSFIKGNYFLHWHEHIELLYCIKKGSVFYDTREYLMNKHDLIIINANEYHATYSGFFYCMRISPSFFTDVYFDNSKFARYIKRDEAIKKSFYSIRQESKFRKPGFDMEIKSLVYHLMSYLLRNYNADSVKKSYEAIQNSKENIMDDILTYIASNCHEKLTTSTLANRFYLSEHYFCSFFKQHTGMTPVEYINKFRIEKACTLLKNTRQSITDIALAVGFYDSNYFSRIFKKHIGATPREYKKSHLENSTKL